MIFNAYKEFAIVNRQLFLSVESFLSINTYFLISPNNEIRSQCAYTLLMLWSLFHEEKIWKPHQDAFTLSTILQQSGDSFLHQTIKSLYKEKFSNTNYIDSIDLNTSPQRDNQSFGDTNSEKSFHSNVSSSNYKNLKQTNENLNFFKNVSILRWIQSDKNILHNLAKYDKRFPGEHSLLFLKVIEQTEMLLEMMIQSKVGKQRKWFFVFFLEVIKSLTKTWQVISSKASISLHYSVLPEKKDIWTKETNWTELRGTRTNKIVPQHPSYLLYLPPSLNDFLRSPWDRLMWYLSELMYIWRPVLYVGLILHFFYNSSLKRSKYAKFYKWLPWLISFLVDITSQRLAKYLLTKSEYNASTINAEFIRRKHNILSYLMRNPFFNVFIRPLVQWMCNKLKRIPLINFLVSNVAEYLLTLQTYYFCTAAS